MFNAAIDSFKKTFCTEVSFAVTCSSLDDKIVFQLLMLMLLGGSWLGPFLLVGSLRYTMQANI